MELRTLAICALLAITSPTLGEVVYVDIDATPNGDGLSWKTAFIDLQDGLDAARLLEGPDEVWIAEGIYHPTYQVEEGNPRAVTFLPGGEVSIYGGFEGGPCAGCDTDLDGDNQVAVEDVLLLLSVWGPCE